MSNPNYPGGPYQPRDPYQQYPGGAPQYQQPYQQPQYAPQYQYQPQQQFAPQHGYPAPPARRGGGAVGFLAGLVLIAGAVLCAVAAFSGRDGGEYSELRAKLVYAIIGAPYATESSQADTYMAVTWVAAVVTGILGLLVMIARGSVISVLSGLVATALGIYYVAAIVKINSDLGEYFDVGELLVWPIAAAVLWFVAALLCFVAGSRRPPTNYAPLAR